MHCVFHSLCYTACLVLASSCNAAFISHCQYFGPQCSHRMGDSEEDALLQSNIIGVSFASNVSCGDSPGAATEYCALENPESEPNIDRFQCFSLYRFDKGTKRRILVVAGCIFNHPLSSCTTHTCNFSHEVDLDQGRTNATLHYCCCHTKDDCNRNGIFGNPSTPSAMTSTSEGHFAPIAIARLVWVSGCQYNSYYKIINISYCRVYSKGSMYA